MAADLVLATPVAAGRHPRLVVARRTARKAARSGALWGWVFGVYLSTQALAYASTYKTAAERRSLAAEFGSNAGISALVGPAHEIQTVAGYTVWKCLAVLAVVGSVWGLLTSTRLLRGEEDAGRWELLLAGQTTRRGAARQGVAGLGVGLLALWAVTAVITIAVGRSSKVDISATGALFLAVAVVAGAAVFLAVGALASQLAATRRQAAACSAVVLGVSYALRMVADSGTGLSWLRWATPLGWVEQLQPLTAPQPLVLLPIVALIAALSFFTVRLAGRRDLGGSTFPDRSSARAHTRLLSGPVGLTVRMTRPTVLGWAAGIAAYALLLGLVAKSAAAAFSASSSLERVLSRFGARGADAYLSVAFLIVAVMVALLAAGQVGATRDEEAEGRLEHLLVRPVSRSSWLVERVCCTAVAVVLAGLVAGFFAWLGASSQHAGVSFTGLMGAGLNVVPAALCLLGIGTLVLGLRARAATGFTYAVLAWSFLVDLVGGIVGLNHWVLDTSLFHQLAAAPSIPPDWTSGAVLVTLGVLGVALGTVAFSRRDLTGE